jgi:RHS repeat-associated protein
VSSTAKVERTFRCGPYGEDVTTEGTQTIPFIFGYKGGYRMPGGNKGETSVANGLYHYGERYYDPTTGRWTQVDPRRQVADPAEVNMFASVGDPVDAADPRGESKYGRGAPCEYAHECYLGEGEENHAFEEFVEDFNFPGGSSSAESLS